MSTTRTRRRDGHAWLDGWMSGEQRPRDAQERPFKVVEGFCTVECRIWAVRPPCGFDRPNDWLASSTVCGGRF